MSGPSTVGQGSHRRPLTPSPAFTAQIDSRAHRGHIGQDDHFLEDDCLSAFVELAADVVLLPEPLVAVELARSAGWRDPAPPEPEKV